MCLERLKQALMNLQEKLAFYEEQLSITASPTQKFELKKEIQKCEQEIKKCEQEINKRKKIIEKYEINLISEQEQNLDKLLLIHELHSMGNNVQATIQQKFVEHKNSDCFFFKLEGRRLSEENTFQILLYLTINFSLQKQKLLQGNIWFGIKGGELNFHLTNCLIPYQNRQITSPRFIFIDNSHITVEVNSKGDEGNPSWVFSSSGKTSERFILEGSLVQKEWATVDAQDKPCHIEALFEVSKIDVDIAKCEDTWLYNSDNIGPNKRTFIKTQIINWLYEHKFKSHLSQVQLTYG